MKIWCLVSLILTIIPDKELPGQVPLSAQIPPQPIATTNSECLNDCLKQGSLVFAAANLRNFRKIILHIEEFCDTREELLKCAQSCTNEEQNELAKKTSLSAYICMDKLEEFRLVKDCMENKEDTDSINKCSTQCGHPSDATIQLDSSSAAPVNPFAFIDSITQVCRTIECVIKCSIKESNKICAGSGYLFKDIGYKQVQEASEQLQNDAFNSTSSVTQQSVKIYLESLPQQCTYIINPAIYNMTFEQHEANDEFSTLIPEIEGNTMKSSSIIDEEGMTEMTSELFNTNNDDIITRIFDAKFTTQSIETSKDDDTTEENLEKMTVIHKIEDEFNILMESSISDNVFSTVEGADNTSMKSETSVQIHIQPTSSHEATGEEEKEESAISSVKFTATDDRSRNVEMDNEEGIATVANHEHDKEEENEGSKQEHEQKEEEEEESKEDETTTMNTIQNSNENDKEERESSNEMSHLQHLSTPTTAQEMTERTIVVVNDDDKDQEIDTNTIVQHTPAEQQKDATKQGIREGFTLSLLLILPLISLYLFNQ